MKEYIEINKSTIGYSFTPKLNHTIRTAPDTVQIFGGVLHGYAASVVEKDKSIPISSVSTTFLNRSTSLSPITANISLLIERKSLSVYNVHLEQEDTLLSVSQVICSPNPIPADQSKFIKRVPSSFPEPYNWLWDKDNDSLFTDLKAQISLNEGAILWLEGYKTDISVICTLSDFSSIALVQFLGQIPRTTNMHSQFFSLFDSDKLFSEFEILGFSPGSVNVRLDHYDLNGNPVSFTRLSSALYPLDPNMINHFNKNYKP
jgi:hypothetical protein